MTLPHQNLVAAIHKACPELSYRECLCGDKIPADAIGYCHCGVFLGVLEVLHKKTIGLAEVLRATQEVQAEAFSLRYIPITEFQKKAELLMCWGVHTGYWDLLLPLSEQSEETLAFLSKVI